MKKIFFLIICCSIFILTLSAVGAIEVPITTKIPGCGGSSTTCYVGTGMSVVENIIGETIKYFTYLASLAAVLFIVVNGILYSMAGMDASLKDGAKKRIIKMLLWLVVLMLSGVILNAVAPWIYK